MFAPHSNFLVLLLLDLTILVWPIVRSWRGRSLHKVRLCIQTLDHGAAALLLAGPGHRPPVAFLTFKSSLPIFIRTVCYLLSVSLGLGIKL